MRFVLVMGGAMAEPDIMLEVSNLRTYFFLDEGIVRAVDGVGFDIRKRQTVAIVGESGSGKSVTAQSVLRIVPSPGRIVDGGADQTSRPAREFRHRDGIARGRSP